MRRHSIARLVRRFRYAVLKILQPNINSMAKTYVVETTAFVTVEAETDDEATKFVLAWQDAAAGGSVALAEFEKAIDIATVEFDIGNAEVQPE